MEYVQCEQGYAVQVRISSVPEWAFLVQVKCIISMNKIWSAGKAHHQVLEKGWALIHCTIHWPDISCFQLTVLAYNICIQYNWKCYVLSQLRVHQGAKFPWTYLHHFLP